MPLLKADLRLCSNFYIMQNWYDVKDNSKLGGNGVHTGTMFLEFHKAFDLVDHKILLTKLAEMHISRAFWSILPWRM